MGENSGRPQRAGGLFAGGGFITGLAALIGASCCVLPVLLVQAGVSTALIAHLGVFARAKPYLLAVTALLVLTGFVTAFWGGRQPRPFVLALLIMAAALVIGAYVMPYYERALLDWIDSR